MSLSPAVQIAAFHAAGVPVRRLAPVFQMRRDDVYALILGIRLHEALQDDPLLRLAWADDHCMIVGCGRPQDRFCLCARHRTRLRKGRPLLGPRRRPGKLLIGTCVFCGITWCELTARRHLTCRSPECLYRTPARAIRNSARDRAILERIHAGESYASIAADFALNPSRIAQIANRAGVFRYAPRTVQQKAARPHSIARAEAASARRVRVKLQSAHVRYPDMIE